MNYLDIAINVAKLYGDLHPGKTQYTYIREGKKADRNGPCPCGSGKKYKRCCRGSNKK